jgi:osmotically-inducible protein OsmY
MRQSISILPVSHFELFARKTPKKRLPCRGALVLARGLAGRATYQMCKSGGSPADERITASVQAQLAQQPDIEAPDQLYVQTISQVVYLSGTVSSGWQRCVAEAVAIEVAGVDRVESSISVIH